MPRVFISNTKVQESGDIKIDASFDVSNFVAEQHKSGDTTFIIDVHCKFKEAEKMQQHGGVIIYRHLLSKFKDCQDKLKVIFYSPISKEDLVKLKPENYVLTLLPFVELFPKDKDGNDIPNWNFKDALEAAEKEICPQFNNASENLLSGWALFKSSNRRRTTDFVESNYRTKEEIKQGKKGIARSIAFIDDQLEEWKVTYKQIFEPDTSFAFLNYDRFLTSTSGYDEQKIVNLDEIDRVDLVISDFYLEENHETNHWMSKSELADKSGFKLYETIKGKKGKKAENKAVPYVMHTSSNKIQYFKFLDSNGVDDWLIKDIRLNATKEEKQTTFEEFKNVIEEFTSGKNSELYVKLKLFWKRILEIENSTTDNWAFTKKNKSVEANLTYSQYDKKTGKYENVPCISYNANAYSKKEIIGLLKDSWSTLRAFVTKQKHFTANIGSIDKSFTAASICSNLGKLFEFYGFNQKMDFNMVFRYIFSIRNASSHFSDYRYFSIEDCLIYFDLWLSVLEDKETDLLKFFAKKSLDEVMHQDKGGGKGETFKYRLLYCHIQFYNSSYSNQYPKMKAELLNRIEQMFDSLTRNPLIEEVNKSGKLKSAISNYPVATLLKSPIKLDSNTKPNSVYIVNA